MGVPVSNRDTRAMQLLLVALRSRASTVDELAALATDSDPTGLVQDSATEAG